MQQSRSDYDASRKDDVERQVYKSSRWRKLSRDYRAQHPLCERCEKENKIVPVSLVHHKQPIADGGDPFDWDNLESICRSCHAKEDEHKAFAIRREEDPYKHRRQRGSGGLDVRGD